MYLVKDIGGAIGLMAAALVLLGTWPVVLAVLERRGRLPQHTYLDYSITNFLAAVLIALTFGQIGGDTPETPNFLTQLTQPQDYWPSIMFALAGGVVITLGTVATQYGWAYVGLSVTEVMASSLKVVIGTTLNYFLDGRINRAEVLFPGVGCFLIAACLGSLVHSSNAADNQEKLSNSRNYSTGNTAKEDLTQRLLEEEEPKDCEEAKPALPKAVEKVEAGTADFLIDLEDKRSIKTFSEQPKNTQYVFSFADDRGDEHLTGPRVQHAGGAGDRDVRGGVLLAVRAGVQPGDQRPVAHAARRRAAPGGLHRLLLLLPLLAGRRRGAQRVVPLPPRGRRAAVDAAGVPRRRGGEGAGAAGGDGVRAGQRVHVHGRAGGRVRGGGLRAGAAAGEHVLGRGAVRGVPEVVEEDVHAAGEHALHVRRRHVRAHGLLRAQEAALTQPTLLMHGMAIGSLGSDGREASKFFDEDGCCVNLDECDACHILPMVRKFRHRNYKQMVWLYLSRLNT
ncbi:uncharacterized protein LOC123407384 isoform X1 [Hordeum vulgare subsp. vulgare]|uniref:uncharacterized protein LOC123407384 isoform X1 n=1 Tax=Hordeum vulgare subsp. vulgare TaxID=112509 RepID=UPI001D1A3962|nr:uncharacterized protein LOC123407384 isoform X1 [Hordeum vulgare subsp. vulgare]XP_044956444.1 uncharacterized protein LOC123407384 isoform X1 [Hordeum vulgare subsp. vulgare]